MRPSQGSLPICFALIVAVATGCFAALAVDAAASENSFPPVIVAGSDGALWFTAEIGKSRPRGRIGRITTAGKITGFTVPTDSRDSSDESLLNGLTAGPDGALWFTEFGSTIGRITTDGKITEFTIPTKFFNLPPARIAAGPDGALWFTEIIGNIRRITTAGGPITGFAIPGAGIPPDNIPWGIVAGPDGALWYTAQSAKTRRGGKIGRITTAGAVTEFALPARSGAFEIVAGPDGALWFTALSGKIAKIGRITTAGAITEFALPARSGPCGITAGPDGALWFTDSVRNKIGRITTDGAITEFALRARSGPCGITAGPDGALWFTEQRGRIGRITTVGAITEFAAPVISRYRLTHKVFVAGRSSTPASAAGARSRHPRGTRFDYTLSKAATVQIVIARRRAGRRKGKKCVAPTKKLANAKKCIRTFERGKLTRSSHRGVNRVAFSGRIGSKALKPGRYQATLTATDAEKNSSKAKKIFTIVTR